MNQLFDKSIELHFFDSVNSATPIDSIVIPDTGYKPNITLSATFRPSDVMNEVEIRIVNYYPSVPLSSYKWMTITAGYKHNSDSATLSGQVKVAYQESPSPDGVTFISLLVGHAEDVLNRDITVNTYPNAGMTTDTIFDALIIGLSSTGTPWKLVNSSFLKALPVHVTSTTPKSTDIAGFNFQGKPIDCLNKIKDRWKIAYLIDGTNLIIYTPNKGRTGEGAIQINWLSSPPMATASGITFVAPWNPKIRPGIVIQIDPLYFRQTFGGAQITYQPDGLMIVQTVSLNYNTVTNQNAMTVLALNTYEVPQASGS